MGVPRKKSKTLGLATLAFLLLLGVMVGCTNATTKNDLSGDIGSMTSTTFSYETIEYIALRFIESFDSSSFGEILSANSHLFENVRGTDVDALIEFIIDNFELFFDEKLYDGIIKEAEELFKVSLGTNFQNELLKAREKLLDYTGDFGGVNLFKYSVDDLFNDYTIFFENTLTGYEKTILEDYLEMVCANYSKLTISNFLKEASANNNISEGFAMFLEISAYRFELFTYLFPDSEAIGSVVIFGSMEGGHYCETCNHYCTYACMRPGRCLDHFITQAMSIPGTIIALWVEQISQIIALL